MPNSPISHVEGLFDIVGKTIENVTYAPAQHGDGASMRLHFTDGSCLDITVANNFQGAIYAQQEL